ncbi:hypothetical protein LTR64_005502 [Lithohypha guttulata]|uniref:uncharacterized protein n=1 Tax=Lithohypha guttulata TaxID=1690604 RepID=UPI002DDF90AF|nr:hypothetical protein LTR51_002706 [Lithohypha guttulata]
MTLVNFLTATVLFILAALSQSAAAIDKLLLSQIVLAKVNYYRALSGAAPVIWKDVNSLVSGLEANNCSVTYDYWDDKGRIIFSIGRQDNQFPDTVNGSYFAVDHWWEQRKLYDPKSGEYDELQPFYDTWEFTQMVWSASTNIACSWGVSECDVPADQVVANVTKYLQFVCNMEPAGNKWEQFYANVHCPDCTGVEPQTTTIDPLTISFEGEKKRAARSVPTPPAKISYSDEQLAELKAEVDRVEQYRYLSPEEVMGPDFIPGWSNAGINAMLAKEGIFADMDTTEMEDMVHSLRAKTLGRAADDPKQKRDAPPSGEAGKAWGNHYISTVNAWRKQHGQQTQLSK